MKILKKCAYSLAISSIFLGFSYADAAKEKFLGQEIDTSSIAIAEIFHKMAGKSDGKRKLNHSKGFCTLGEFVPANNISDFVNIPILKNKLNAEVRFSKTGSALKASDKIPVHGFAVKLTDKDGNEWDMAMTNNEINFASTKEEFAKFFLVQMPGKDGKVNEDEKKKYFSTNPSAKRFLASGATLQTVDSVSHVSFFSAHTFFIRTNNNEFIPSRIEVIPQRGQQTLSKKEIDKLGDNYLETNFKRDLKSGPVEYFIYFTLAGKDDVINDASMPWTGLHKRILVGTLKINKFNKHTCNEEVFLPGLLPEGINPPQDELFDLRNEVYGILFADRQ